MDEQHAGSDFDDFLAEEGLLEEVEAVAAKPTTRPIRRRQPTHPGEILREDVFPALRLSVAEAVRQLRVSRQT